ncbi:hypothetical protein BESB_042440 [Besnoitia besnoiti]|uniref:Uncharacterized protein n=1 Tax=Besnoitia besnoiti TaxID=94643 RepID=A0A2A9M2V1_BESBE|nr:uncharacterized protein BESB_042440 [Besnoitia besnoiti]PFH30621.1 hypothetical protein BESB_042440 [Besnoitia besnoiti]
MCIKYSGIQRIFEKPTFVYKLYEYHDIHFGSRLLNVSLYGIHGSDSCWPGTCLVTGMNAFYAWYAWIILDSSIV